MRPIPHDHGSVHLVADATLSDVPSPDLVLVPGGPGQNEQMANRPVHEWLRGADATSSWTASVCTGSLILAAAGLLTGCRATSHWIALEHLGKFGAEATCQRVMFDGKYVTAAGVSAGIDMALALTARVAGEAAAQASQLMLEYDPEPPYGAGSPATAPQEVVECLRSRFRPILTG
ncbi:MAG TPA: DJ-1/PfpI family protein [Pseudonocardiaceae bacterium]|nr:DJ-1/PfpI family protein [Pseudonocardiaceae bacterium]